MDTIMAERFDPNDLVTLDELALSTMWETSALVEVLERNSIPCAAGRVGDDPRAALARTHGHPATATREVRAQRNQRHAATKETRSRRAILPLKYPA